MNHFSRNLIGWNHFQEFGMLFTMENNFFWGITLPYLCGITFFLECDSIECHSKECDSKELKFRKSYFVLFGIVGKVLIKILGK